MNKQWHGGKGDAPRPESKPGAYAKGYENIRWGPPEGSYAANLDLFQRFNREATLAQVVTRGLPFGVGHWVPVNFCCNEKLRIRFRWGHEWKCL